MMRLELLLFFKRVDPCASAAQAKLMASSAVPSVATTESPVGYQPPPRLLLTLSTCVVVVIAAVPIAVDGVCVYVLAVGARRLSTAHAIVTRLSAIEDLANMTVVCVSMAGACAGSWCGVVWCGVGARGVRGLTCVFMFCVLLIGTLTRNEWTLAESVVVGDVTPRQLVLLAATAIGRDGSGSVTTRCIYQALSADDRSVHASTHLLAGLLCSAKRPRCRVWMSRHALTARHESGNGWLSVGG